jgi:hypothetical protein
MSVTKVETPAGSSALFSDLELDAMFVLDPSSVNLLTKVDGSGAREIGNHTNLIAVASSQTCYRARVQWELGE